MERSRIIAFYIFVLIFAVNYVSTCFANDTIETTSIINQAEFGLNSAFMIVAEAQNAGADTAELIAKLNLASDFLSKAYLAKRVNDYENASSYAMECIETVEGVNIEADKLKSDAQINQNNIVFLNLLGSFVGLIFLVILGVLCWKGVKKWYFRSILNKTPKVDEI